MTSATKRILGPRNQRERLWIGLGWLYFIFAAVYVMYGFVTGSGLVAWLAELSIRLFNTSFSAKLLAFLAMMILFTPGIMLYRYIESRRQRAEPTVEDTRVESLPPLTTTDVLYQSRHSTLWGGLAFILLPWVIGYPLYLLKSAEATAEIGMTPQVLTLAPGVPAPSAPAKFLELHAVPQLDYAYVLDHKNTNGTTGSSDYFAPLTPPDWVPSQPVRYVLHLNRYGPAAPQEFAGPYIVATEADGVAGPVKGMFARDGITFASPVYLVHRITLQNGRVPDRSDDTLPLLYGSAILGGFVGIIMIIIGLVYRWLGARALARKGKPS